MKFVKLACVRGSRFLKTPETVRSRVGRKFKIQLDTGWVLCYNRGMNSEQLQLIEKKYGKLIHKISHQISGDSAISDHDDNVQDLWISAMEAIRGYQRKEGKPFEEFWGTVGFDKYLKTCLWNTKNSKGARMTKRFNITKGTVSIQEHEEILHIEDGSNPADTYDKFYEDLPMSLSDTQKQIVQAVVESPDCITEGGRINVTSLSQTIGKGWGTTKQLVQELGEKLQNNL